MGERELREKYGGKLPKAINRAIRAEVPGGNEALDRLTDLAAAAKQSHWHDKQGRPTPEAEAYFKHQSHVIERMDAQVRRTWSVPADAGRDRGGKRPVAKRSPGAKRFPARKGKPTGPKRPR
jgi:hypothetical protein